MEFYFEKELYYGIQTLEELFLGIYAWKELYLGKLYFWKKTAQCSVGKLDIGKHFVTYRHFFIPFWISW